jgi:hypothetical protein
MQAGLKTEVDSVSIDNSMLDLLAVLMTLINGLFLPIILALFTSPGRMKLRNKAY